MNETLDEKNQRLASEIAEAFMQQIKDKICCICGEKAIGLGEGKIYCTVHFWKEFDKRKEGDIA